MIDQEPECPECGEDMVKRTNSRTGDVFYGCIMYPYCNGTVKIHETRQKRDYPDWAKDPRNR